MTDPTNKFLITTSYRGLNKTIIWLLDLNEDSLVPKKQLKIYDNNFLPIVKDHAVWGLSYFNGDYYVSEANGISVLNKNFERVKRFQDTERLRDCHDIRIIDGNIYIANTLCDSVEIFDIELVHKKTITLKKLPVLKNIKTLSKKHVTSISDCFHINNITDNDSQIFFTLSFISKKAKTLIKKPPFFKYNRETTPGCVYNYSEKKIFIKNISGAHDGEWVNGEFWVSHTYDMSVGIYSCEGKKLSYNSFSDSAIYRGLAITDEHVVVGATKVCGERTGARGTYSSIANERGGKVNKNSMIYVYDRKWKLIRKYILPDNMGKSPEIFKIVCFNE